MKLPRFNTPSTKTCPIWLEDWRCTSAQEMAWSLRRSHGYGRSGGSNSCVLVSKHLTRLAVSVHVPLLDCYSVAAMDWEYAKQAYTFSVSGLLWLDRNISGISDDFLSSTREKWLLFIGLEKFSPAKYFRCNKIQNVWKRRQQSALLRTFQQKDFIWILSKKSPNTKQSWKFGKNCIRKTVSFGEKMFWKF